MTDLAKLVVRLEAQSAQLITELEKANRKIDRFASATHKTLTKWAGNITGALSARALVQFGHQVLKTEGDLVAMAERAGTTVENVSRLGYVASQSASNIDTLGTGLGALADRAQAAADQGGASAAAFKKLGIDVRTSAGGLKNSVDLLLEVADQFAQYEDGAAKSALATDLMKNAGKELIPTLNRGAAGIEELAKQSDAYGITVSTKAALAANEFNDQLSTLGSITRGIVGKALQEVMPILSKFNKHMIETSAGAERANTWSRVLAAGLKILISAGAVVGAVFDTIGSTIGQVAAGMAAFAQRDFKRAILIFSQIKGEAIKDGEELGQRLIDIWTTTADDVAKTAENADKKLKKTLMFGGGGADAIEEINLGVNIKKTGLTPTEQFFEDLQALTRTANESALRSYHEQREALQLLFDTGRIGAEQYAARLEEVNKKLDDATGVTELQNQALERRKQIEEEGQAVYEATRTVLEQYNAELVRLQLLLQQGAIDQETFNRAVADLKFEYNEATDSAGAFFQRAAHGARDILGQGIADSIRHGFDEGAKGALRSFGALLTDLLAQAVAADLMKRLFGASLGMGGTGGGWLGALATAFGGAKDSGGPGRAGVAYAIGTGAQPEIFVPDTPGHFYPRGEGLDGGGRMVVNQRFSVTSERGDRISRRTEQQVAAAASRGLAMASRRNN